MALQCYGLSQGTADGMMWAALIMVLTSRPEHDLSHLARRRSGSVAATCAATGTGVGFLIGMTMANLGLVVVFVVSPLALHPGGSFSSDRVWLAWNTRFTHGGVNLQQVRRLQNFGKVGVVSRTSTRYSAEPCERTVRMIIVVRPGHDLLDLRRDRSRGSAVRRATWKTPVTATASGSCSCTGESKHPYHYCDCDLRRSGLSLAVDVVDAKVRRWLTAA